MGTHRLPDQQDSWRQLREALSPQWIGRDRQARVVPDVVELARVSNRVGQEQRTISALVSEGKGCACGRDILI